MKPVVQLILLGCFFLSSVSLAGAPAEIKSYGVYVKGKSGYVKAKAYKHNYIDFPYFAEMPYIERDGDALEIIVYKKDFNPTDIAFAIRPIKLASADQAIDVEIAPMDKADMYRVTYDKPIPADTVLMVYEGSWFYPGYGTVVLGNTERVLEALFSDMSLEAYAALPSLQDALKAYPNNKKLKSLVPAWEKAEKEERDNRDYDYVDEAWKQYEEATKIKLKVRYLEKARGEINGYLNRHPKGLHSEEAKKRRAEIEVKLKEYEPMI